MTKKFDAPLESRDVESYRQEAMAMITRWGPFWMKYDEDCVTNVATSIAKAEHAFDPSRGLKRVTLRCTYGRRQVWAEARRRNKWANRPMHFSIDLPFPNGKNKHEHLEDYRESKIASSERAEELIKKRKMVRKLINNSGLTPKQKKYMRLRHINGISVTEIAERNYCSKQAVDCVLRIGMRNIKSSLKKNGKL
jgi:DNA-directed RNA polymerase specialized sigma24 family protein